ncbi:hypothetical protein ACP0HM_01520 [Escherichia coli]
MTQFAMLMTRYIINLLMKNASMRALASLKQRMQQLEPRADSKEPLVVQQVGLLIALLPEIGRLQRQITQVPQETPVSA